ncbi:MAG: IS1 family transposase [Fibromonadaceae bacterium]|nr:IS1 family transposase [Fibromonadaceae bacterium]
MDELLELLKPFNIGTVYSDSNYAYHDKIHAESLVTGKRNTQQIERRHLTLRTRTKRLCRKTICFSKNKDIRKSIIGTFINTFFFGRTINISTYL